MKNRLSLLCCFAIVLLFSACGGTEKTEAVEPVAAEYSFKLPSKGPGSVAQERLIRFDPAAEKHLLRLGKFQTPMHFVIGRSDTGAVFITQKIIDQQFKEGEEVVLDISALEKGLYSMSFSAMEEGCVFQFTVDR